MLRLVIQRRHSNLKILQCQAPFTSSATLPSDLQGSSTEFTEPVDYHVPFDEGPDAFRHVQLKPIQLKPVMPHLDLEVLNHEDVAALKRSVSRPSSKIFFGNDIVHVQHALCGLHLLLRLPMDYSLMNENCQRLPFALFLFWNCLLADKEVTVSSDPNFIERSWLPMTALAGQQLVGVDGTVLYSTKQVSPDAVVQEVTALREKAKGIRMSEEFFNVAKERFILAVHLQIADDGANIEAKLVDHHQRLLRRWLAHSNVDPRQVLEATLALDFSAAMNLPLVSENVSLVPVKGAVLAPDAERARQIMEAFDCRLSPAERLSTPVPGRGGDVMCVGLPPMSCNRASFGIGLMFDPTDPRQRFFSDYITDVFRRLGVGTSLNVEAVVMNDVKLLLIVLHWTDPRINSQNLPLLVRRVVQDLTLTKHEVLFTRFRARRLLELESDDVYLHSLLSASVVCAVRHGELDVLKPVTDARFASFREWVASILASPLVYVDCPSLSLISNQRSRDPGQAFSLGVDADVTAWKTRDDYRLRRFQQELQKRQLATKHDGFYEC
ncbi:MAG: hypothetical protein KVP17_004121 [Porospora cf. gigantea B]|uniref:uncharacterized protein n=2 Tax=Porospora cf. gigantea B TaxID=2853592 RepID=UPI003571AAE0|nr:MAG: hypothetical protein KVP17_004121 [Porospora cf. gigantea B]